MDSSAHALAQSVRVGAGLHPDDPDCDRLGGQRTPFGSRTHGESYVIDGTVTVIQSIYAAGIQGLAGRFSSGILPLAFSR